MSPRTPDAAAGAKPPPPPSAAVALGRRRAKTAKTSVAVGSALAFVAALPLVQGTRQSHPRPTHALKPPAQMLVAVAERGFARSDLAPTQAPPIVASGGS